ncbi:hypothetical protein D5086_000524, partial [Populus alba]
IGVGDFKTFSEKLNSKLHGFGVSDFAFNSCRLFLLLKHIANAACGLFSIQKNLWRSAPPAHQNIEIWPYGQRNMRLPRHFWILSVHSSPVTLKCISIAVQQQLTRKEAGLARILDEST